MLACSRRVLSLVAFLGLVWATCSRAATVSEDTFNVSISTAPSSNPPISNVYFFRAYTDAGGAPVGQITNSGILGTVNWGDNTALDGLLVPAVQSPNNEVFGLIGQSNGMVVMVITDGTAPSIIGNANFDFASTFGMSEAAAAAALQNGDTTSLIGLLDQAYTGALLPAVQRGAASPGTLVLFDAPTNVGTISVVENPVPEPAALGLLAPLAVVRRRSREVISHRWS